MSYACPICASALEPMSRYPRYVCERCTIRAKSVEGRPLEFFNEGLSGGFVALYADTQQPYDGGHDCWIDGIRCYADEHRFGGIVIEVAA